MMYVDWEADRQRLEGRLQELAFPIPRPWVWIRTAEPFPKSGSARFIIIARTSPNDSTGHYQESPLAADLITPQWAGHHYKAVGLLRRYERDGEHVGTSGDDPPGKPPMWRSFESGTQNLTLEAALFWQRAYRPTKSGAEPPLAAELRWWPGRPGAWPFLRVHAMSDQALSPADLKRAQQARQLLFGVEQRMGRVGRPRLEEETDQTWRETLARADDLKRRQPSLLEKDIAIRLGISPRTLREYRSRKRQLDSI